MLPLSTYSTHFLTVDDQVAFGILGNTTTEVNEDGENRYIRKVLHKIRHFRIAKRKVDVAMSSHTYVAMNFDLNGVILTSIRLQIVGNDFTDIDVSKMNKDVESYNPISGIGFVGIGFDDKLFLYFEKEKDKSAVIQYITNTGIIDNFVPAFSAFNLSNINADIANRITDAGLVDQTSTSLCGYACICFLMITYQLNEYRLFVYDLYYYAEAFYGKNKYLIKPRNWFSASGQVYTIKPKSSDYPVSYKLGKPGKPYLTIFMAEADYIVLASIRCSENRVFDMDTRRNALVGDLISNAESITRPAEIVSLLIKMLKVQEVEDKTNIASPAAAMAISLLNQMNNDHLAGYECLMLIKDDMITNVHSFWPPLPEHWIIYQGDLTISPNLISFSAFTWGEYGKEVNVTPEYFAAEFYGYIKVKM